MKALLLITAALFIAGVQAMPQPTPRTALSKEPLFPSTRSYYDEGDRLDDDTVYKSTPRDVTIQAEEEFDAGNKAPEQKFRERIRGTQTPEALGPQTMPGNLNPSAGPSNVP
jgi:hypothetical protein